MNLYTSSEGRKTNWPLLRERGWRLLLSPAHPANLEGLPYALDNGAWGAHQAGRSFSATAFKKLVEKHGGGADFVIVPDIVAGGSASLEFSRSWLPYLRPMRRLLLPVQDGMDAREVGSLLTDWRELGLFLGGSTEYKLRTMYGWGMVAHSAGRYYHVGRVNSVRRIRLAHEAGANSVDGSSAAIHRDKIIRLSPAGLQPSLLTPRCNVVQRSATT